MYVNDIAAMLRAGGMKVVEVSGWQSRNHGSLRTVSSVVCHHTAGAATGNYPSLNVVTNGRSDLAGPLCNLGLARDGSVYVVSSGVAWHAGATINDSVYGNYNSLGIEAENTGSQPWPNVQVQAYAKLCALLCKHYGIPVSRIVGHKEICSPRGRKIDPAGLPGDMNGLRALTSQYMSGGGAAPGGGDVVEDDFDEENVVKLEAKFDAEGNPVKTYAEIPVNNKRSLFLATSYGNDVNVTGITAVYNSNHNPQIQGLGALGLEADRPGPIGLPENVRHVVVEYVASHDFTGWSF